MPYLQEKKGKLQEAAQTLSTRRSKMFPQFNFVTVQTWNNAKKCTSPEIFNFAFYPPSKKIVQAKKYLSYATVNVTILAQMV